MKHLFLSLLLLALLPAGLLTAQKHERPPLKRPPFHEEVAASGRPAEAPPECTRQVRQFIRYVNRAKPEISADGGAQQRFLSKAMRDAFANHRAVYAEFASKNDTPDLPPDNGDFIGAWDPPTSFRIIGSRWYADRAVVDVLFTWGKNTNYEGDSRLTSYCLIREQNSWKIADVYIFAGKFIEARSLIQHFSGKTY